MRPRRATSWAVLFLAATALGRETPAPTMPAALTRSFLLDSMAGLRLVHVKGHGCFSNLNVR